MILHGEKIFDTFDENLIPLWENLYKKGGAYNLSFVWCKTWWEYFKKSKSIHIYTFWENSQLRLIAPLYIKGKRLFLMGTKPDIYDEFNVLYENPKHLDKFVNYLLNCEFELGFKHINTKSDLSKKLIKNFYNSGFTVISQATETKPKIVAKINKKNDLKLDIKRVEKNLLNNLNEEFVFEFSVEKNLNFIEEFIKFHKERWDGGIMMKKKNLADFTKEIFLNDQNLYLSRLCLKNSGETVAYCFGYIDSCNNYWLSMTSYNQKYKKFAPGKIIIYRLIDELKKVKNINDFDFGRGSENYKYEFSDYEDIIFSFFTYKRSRKYIKIKNFIDKILKLVYRV